jgi:hypothetical protein
MYAGNAGQPYGEEASKFIEKKILKKKIKVKLLSKDRYGRIIGVVNYKEGGFLGTYIFTELIHIYVCMFMCIYLWNCYLKIDMGG